ncbi:hypothetical protein L6452_26013 [Arctium lappa]|uniref:Uncharacterized protein n=1 Tax=Arctium lappa TaxID=4217 RepID=A0ACB9AC05_ARCLA|nr:hypothetical protein L6452_26013 [Arctium lappa]
MFVITNYRMDEVFYILWFIRLSLQSTLKTQSNGSSSYDVKSVLEVVFAQLVLWVQDCKSVDILCFYDHTYINIKSQLGLEPSQLTGSSSNSPFILA